MISCYLSDADADPDPDPDADADKVNQCHIDGVIAGTRWHGGMMEGSIWNRELISRGCSVSQRYN